MGLQFARNYAETVSFQKIPTPGNEVKLRYFSQCGSFKELEDESLCSLPKERIEHYHLHFLENVEKVL